MEKDIDHDIVINSYYVINYFNNKQKEITHLKLQKLMYFLEAIYMHKYEKDRMFTSEFYAWPYGPVSKELYKRFKEFSSFSITINKDEIEKGNAICKENKECVDILYNTFGDMTASDLVTLTHVKGSPWSDNYDDTKCSNIDTECIIPKTETLKWFERIIGE